MLMEKGREEYRKSGGGCDAEWYEEGWELSGRLRLPTPNS